MAGDCVHLAGEVLPRHWHIIFGSRMYLSGSRELGCRGLLWLSLACGHGLSVCSIPRPGCAMAAADPYRKFNQTLPTARDNNPG